MLKYAEDSSKAYWWKPKKTNSRREQKKWKIIYWKLKKKAKKDAFCVQRTIINGFGSKIHGLEEALRKV